MRDREDSTSSFDLFLDTVCNTFGGIVFLAILLAILIQTRAIVKTPDQERDETPRSADQVRELILELDAAQSDYESIATALASLPAPASSIDDAKYRKLEEERAALEEQVAEAIELRTNKTRMLAEQLAKNETIKNENAMIPQDLKDMQAKVDEKGASISSLVASRSKTIAIPRERATSALSVLALLKGSQFYLAKLPSYSAKSFNDAHVTATSFLGGITIKPKPGRGWDLDDTEVDNVVTTARRNGHIISIAVWPDSYKDFGAIKETMVNNNVRYQLWPQKEGEALTVFFGAGQSRAQ